MSDSDFFDLPIRLHAVNGVRIAARVGGDGPPLLLLHGHPQTSAIWHRLWPALTRHRTCVAADLRGYGDSDKPPAAPGHAAHSARHGPGHGGADARAGARTLRGAGA